MEQLHYQFRSESIEFEIRTFEHNKRTYSSGAMFSDGEEYCGFPCDNNNTFKTLLQAINYQIDFFEKMLKRIIDKSDNKSRVRRTENLLSELLKFKKSINDNIKT